MLASRLVHSLFWDGRGNNCHVNRKKEYKSSKTMRTCMLLCAFVVLTNRFSYMTQFILSWQQKGGGGGGGGVIRLRGHAD